MTTPDVLTVNRFLAEMVADGKTAAIIEVSSHALEQNRLGNTMLDTAVFTNISPEHLDYHKDMESYLNAKIQIFHRLKEDGSAIINADDSRIMDVVGKIKERKIRTFGIDATADISAKDVELSDKGTRFTLIASGVGEISVSTNLIGLHNVYNSLAAAAAVLQQGCGLDQIKEGLESFVSVPGRLDLVSGDVPFRVFVDYAHTPDALSNVLKALRSLVRNKLLCVFGCGGDRDKTKRPLMGKIAGDLADYVFVTTDNPRTEDPDEIMKQIEKGMAGCERYIVEPDRKRAIQMAVSQAKEGDIVLIAGKGHEDYQIIGKEKTYFSDTEVALAILGEISG